MHDDAKHSRRDCGDNSALADAILALCCEIRSAREFSSLATKCDLEGVEARLMHAIERKLSDADAALLDQLNARMARTVRRLEGINASQ
jgi:hypothetical protein